MQNIVIDTNFIVTAYKFKIDIFDQLKAKLDFKYQLYVVDETLDELEKLINKASLTDRIGAKIAVQLLKRKNINILKTAKDRSVDELLLALDPRMFIIATQDIALKRKLREKKFKIITIRQKKQIALEM
ncbi:MAG: PIN domain-containing protein [Nanoarchaeota archaeon]